MHQILSNFSQFLVYYIVGLGGAMIGVESVGGLCAKTQEFLELGSLGVLRFSELVAAPSAIFDIGLGGALRRLVGSRVTIAVESWV